MSSQRRSDLLLMVSVFNGPSSNSDTVELCDHALRKRLQHISSDFWVGLIRPLAECQVRPSSDALAYNALVSISDFGGYFVKEIVL